MADDTPDPDCSNLNRRPGVTSFAPSRQFISTFYCSVEYPNPEMYQKYYYIDDESSNSTHTVFACYPNFERVAGDTVRLCVDNLTWAGEELQCEVDPLMDKYRLSGAITAFVFLIFFVILLPNFANFYTRRNELRLRRQMVKSYVAGNEYYHYSRRMMQTKMIGGVPYFGSAIDMHEYVTNEEYLVVGFERRRDFRRCSSSTDSQPQRRVGAGLHMLNSAFPSPRS